MLNFDNDVSKAILYWVRYLLACFSRVVECYSSCFQLEESIKINETCKLRFWEWSNIPQYTVLPANAGLDTVNLHLAKLREAVAQDFASGIRHTNFDSQETMHHQHFKQDSTKSTTLSISTCKSHIHRTDSRSLGPEFKIILLIQLLLHLPSLPNSTSQAVCQAQWIIRKRHLSWRSDAARKIGNRAVE
jgi:hypothetical protein